MAATFATSNPISLIPAVYYMAVKSVSQAELENQTSKKRDEYLRLMSSLVMALDKGLHNVDAAYNGGMRYVDPGTHIGSVVKLQSTPGCVKFFAKVLNSDIFCTVLCEIAFTNLC